MKAPASIPSHASRPNRRGKWHDYLPLLVLLVVAALAATASNQAYDGEAAAMKHWIQDFMGFFLIIFAMLKLFNVPKFADGFQMYDLLARHFRPYALVYPFIELALGLGYLAEWRPDILYPVTMTITVFGALGVIRALIQGLNVNCACMGNILRVPLSSVALVEDLGMAAMAAVMWLVPA